jgi:cell division protein ZapA (FtsZ GTPase activity inhibitor)
MQNPIPQSNLFATPTLAEVQDFISRLPSKEQANANLVFMFTLNACHDLVEKSSETA